jgi:proline iminopeptidase
MEGFVKKQILFPLLLLSILAGLAACQQEKSALFPPIEPLRSGYLQVSDLHQVYWEVCGNPDGIPVIFLHGGPGGFAQPGDRQFFDPQRYYVLLFDQRGSGRSKPLAEIKGNTTQDLIEDINKLRKHVGIEGKAILFGGSWGSTLAIAYAEAHPELVSGLVLRGVFTGRKEEIDFFYHGGAAAFYPEAWERLRGIVPNPDSLDYHKQIFELIQSSDPQVRKRAVDAWAWYEIRISSTRATDEMADQIVNRYDLTALSVLESYYMMNGCFFEEGQLLRDADKIADIPTFIVNGRFDAICPPRTAHELARRLNNVNLEIKDNAGHTSSEPPITEALVRGVDWVADQIEAGS